MIRALLGPMLLTVAALGHAAWRQADLPDPMPVHWGLGGAADGWAPRSFGVALGPALTLLVPLVVVVAARLDPLGRLDLRAPGKLAAMTTLIAAFGLGVSSLVLEVAVAPEPTLDGRWVLLAVGVLFAGLAATLRDLPRNGIAGVRTPWSLASDANWEATHALAVPAMAAAGVTTAVAALVFPEGAALVVGLVALLGSLGVGLYPSLAAAFAGRS